MHNIFIAGGAGFIGSHFTAHLLSLPETQRITIYDNFSSGNITFLEKWRSDKRLFIIKSDIDDFDRLTHAMNGHDTVIHLASNPDIARAAVDPIIDFNQGTALTKNIVEAMRLTHSKRILYASGSGVYGEVGTQEVAEDYGPLLPISTYGASKLAGETLICAYAHMFGLSGIAFRFGNVVGPHQTHGVGYDFIRKLKENPHELKILGNGNQSKSYVYITDIINAVLIANNNMSKIFDVFNVATKDYMTVRDIAKIAIEQVIGLDKKVALHFSDNDRGWKGDVPIIRLNTTKIRSLGWAEKYTAAEAIKKSIKAMFNDE